MSIREYFVKYSFINKQQPLIREHRNAKVYLDLTYDDARIIGDLKDLQSLTYADTSNFVIDFMIEIGEDRDN
jgi:hypothetical protein